MFNNPAALGAIGLAVMLVRVAPDACAQTLNGPRTLAEAELSAFGTSTESHIGLSPLSLSLAPGQDAPATATTAPASTEITPTSTADAADLAKQLNNPVASLISVPFQFNADFGYGEDDDGFRLTLNVQPVIPIKINDEWTIISRTILPIIYQEDVVGEGDEFGLGDTIQSFFLSPAKPGKWIWGAGPAFLLPTATDDVLGTEKFGLGPTGLVLRQHDGWTYGMLANHICSVAGDDDRADVNATFLQPFLSYTTPKAFTLGVNLESTYDWEAEQWTVPINVFASQLVKLGHQPVSFTAGVRYYAESPDGGPEWGLRFVVTLLFPS